MNAVTEYALEPAVGEDEFDAAVDAEPAAFIFDRGAHDAEDGVIVDRGGRDIAERPFDSGPDRGITAVLDQDAGEQMVFPEVGVAEFHLDSAGDLHAAGVSGFRGAVGGA